MIKPGPGPPRQAEGSDQATWIRTQRGCLGFRRPCSVTPSIAPGAPVLSQKPASPQGASQIPCSLSMPEAQMLGQGNGCANMMEDFENHWPVSKQYTD